MISKKLKSIGGVIMYRTKDFNKLLSKELQNPNFAREYFLSKMKELEGEQGLSFFEALKHVIRIMGVKEFANLVRMDRQNISRILTQNKLPKIGTLNRLFAPLKLKIRLDIEKIAS